MQVLVTRAAQGSSELAEHLRALGAEPVLIPAIDLVAPSSFAPLDTALAHLDTFHWLLFTSANAVEAFARRRHPVPPARANSSSVLSPAPRPNSLLATDPFPNSVLSTGAPRAEGRDLREGAGARFLLPPALKLAAIGPATARALDKLGRAAAVVPPQAVAESLTAALRPHARQPDGSPTRFLLVRAEEAREHLPDSLRAAGAEVTVAPGYRTVIPPGSVERLRELLGGPKPRLDAIAFTSSSTARNLIALCEAAGVVLPTGALRISIGPITSQTLRELGIPPHAESPEATVKSLADTVMSALQGLLSKT